MRYLALAGVCVGVCTLLTACGASEPADPVASVGETDISRAALEDQLAQERVMYTLQTEGQADAEPFPEPGSDAHTERARSTLEALVTQEVLADVATRCGDPCAVSAKDVAAERARIVKENFDGSSAQFNSYLRQVALSEADVTRLLTNDLRAERLRTRLERGITVTPAAVRRFYTTNRAQFRTPEQREVFHILVGDEAKAKALAARVRAGDDFGTLARASSLDAGSKAQGGSLGTQSEGQLGDAFDSAVAGLEDGEVTVVRTPFGWHVVRVETTPARTVPFSEARAQIRAQLLSQKLTAAYDARLAKARARLGVTYHDSSLDPAAAQDAGTSPATAP